MKNIGYRRLKPNNRSLPPLCPLVGGLAPENNSFRVIESVYRKSWADVARAPVAGRSVNEASDASAVFTPAALGMNSGGGPTTFSCREQDDLIQYLLSFPFRTAR